MLFVFKRLALVLSISAAWGADKERFQAAPASSYPAKQTIAGVTVAADVFVSDAKARPAFGKNNPYNYGILPVLVVIQNDSGKAIRVEALESAYVPPGGGRVEATPAEEVRFARGPRKPDLVPGPVGIPGIGRSKNPLDGWEIEGRAFAAKMIPAGQSASGFFYFQAGFRKGSKLYLTGLSEADTGKELFYYEIPLVDGGVVGGGDSRR